MMCDSTDNAVQIGGGKPTLVSKEKANVLAQWNRTGRMRVPVSQEEGRQRKPGLCFGAASAPHAGHLHGSCV